MQGLKKELEFIQLWDYPGENVLSWANDIKNICDQLWSAGHWDHNLLNAIIKCFKDTNCLNF